MITAEDMLNLAEAGPDQVGWIVTASRDSRTTREELDALARELGALAVPRDERPLTGVLAEYGAGFAVVVQKQGLVLSDGRTSVFFHPGMAHVRIKQLAAGETDRMVETMGLGPGMTVLDCTLGLGSDAIVAAFVTGPDGRVTGLEAVGPLAFLVRYGLKHYLAAGRVGEAMARIEVLGADYRAVLPRLPDASYDVVYFDPMFRRPVFHSSGIAPLRKLAEAAPLERGAVEEALRVARCRVVMKERRDSPEFDRLGFRVAGGGKHSSVAFGVRETGRVETS